MRERFGAAAEARTWLQAHGVTVTGTLCEAGFPVGLQVLGAMDYIKGSLHYTQTHLRISDWQLPPRAAFIQSAA